MTETHHPVDAQSGSFVIRMSPIQMFIAGLVGGVLLLCTIGFFILLPKAVSGDTFGGKPTAQVAPTAVNPGEEAPAEITLRDVDTKKDHIRGNKDAKVTIVTYTDLECPFCKRFHTTMNDVMKQYGDRVRWVYRHLPLDSLHSQARTEAIATECASEQGKFWEFTDIIFEKTTSNDGLDLTKMSEYAKSAGLNVQKFTSCWEAKKYADVVQADEADGQSAGARGTPYSIVIGKDGQKVPINGAYPKEAIQSTLEQMLNA